MVKLCAPAVIGLCLTFFAVGVAQAQGLTTAEEASRTQRQLTQAEQKDRNQNCEIIGARTGQLELANGLIAEVRSIEAMRFLLLIQWVIEDSDQRIVKFPDLPNGGIGPLHLCGATELESPQFRTKESVENGRVIALRLARSVDIEYDYPTSAPLIAERGQIIEIPKLSYAVIPISNREAADSILGDAQKSSRVDQNGVVIIFERAILVPLRSE